MMFESSETLFILSTLILLVIIIEIYTLLLLYLNHHLHHYYLKIQNLHHRLQYLLFLLLLEVVILIHLFRLHLFRHRLHHRESGRLRSHRCGRASDARRGAALVARWSVTASCSTCAVSSPRSPVHPVRGRPRRSTSSVRSTSQPLERSSWMTRTSGKCPSMHAAN